MIVTEEMVVTQEKVVTEEMVVNEKRVSMGDGKGKPSRIHSSLANLHYLGFKAK